MPGFLSSGLRCVWEWGKYPLWHLDYNSPYLLAVVLIKLTYVDVLTADIENKVIVLKPVLNEYSGDQAEEVRVWKIWRLG